MSTYKFAPVPDNASIAAAVTTLVCAWFLVAAGTILTDPNPGYTQRLASAEPKNVASAPVHDKLAIAPEARLTIHVVAQRLTPAQAAKI